MPSLKNKSHALSFADILVLMDEGSMWFLRNSRHKQQNIGTSSEGQTQQEPESFERVYSALPPVVFLLSTALKGQHSLHVEHLPPPQLLLLKSCKAPLKRCGGFGESAPKVPNRASPFLLCSPGLHHHLNILLSNRTHCIPMGQIHFSPRKSPDSSREASKGINIC